MSKLRFPKGYFAYDPSVNEYKDIIECLKKKNISYDEVLITCEPIYGLFNLYKNDKIVESEKLMVVSRGSIIARSDYCGLGGYELLKDAWGEGVVINAEKLKSVNADSFLDAFIKSCVEKDG
ncbi:hypothetical protein FFONT_1046 [Fervidicoccus fontis Kam940]|uniref:Uncharacterized protein n=1 Tax=Fervidicoccus fontis (strain DSM 19380 / JCM 18336 / VKM B-2539 / Kam940) TaxID=1163730 RepID=I0A227_FERFK|nr:hypothetical protein FFONT_1046 [Fervidicoccus fontis Kam940]